jgi:DNA-binding NtrC family response regulator
MMHTHQDARADSPPLAAARQSSTDGVAEARAEQSQRVLIVEDERRMREMLIASVKECGMVGTGAATAEAALRLLGAEAFAVTLVDLNLPAMNGMDFCELVRERWPQVQVIILTGYGDLDSAKRAIRLEVSDFLTKPCGMDELEVALARARKRWLEHIPLTSGAGRGAEERSAGAGMRETSKSPAAGQARAASPAPSAVSMDEMERQLIFAALARHHGNREATAADVGISVRKLYYRLQQYQKQGLQLPG